MPKYILTQPRYIDGNYLRASPERPIYLELSEDVKEGPGLQKADAQGQAPELKPAKTFLKHPHAGLTETEIETQLTGRLGGAVLSSQEAAARQAGAPTPASVPQTKDALQSAGVIDKKGNKRTSDNEPV